MKIGLLVRVEAKPEYADQVEAALRGAQELAEQEQGTVTWFAFRQDATIFGGFDTFNDEQGRQAHLQGPIAAALGDIAQTMLSSPPITTPVDLLGSKVYLPSWRQSNPQESGLPDTGWARSQTF